MNNVIFPKANHSIAIMSNRERPYIDLIAKGIKKAEGRVYGPKFQKMRVGETVCFQNRHNYVLCKITYLHIFKSFEEMIKSEGLINLLPFAKSEIEGVTIYKEFPGSSRAIEMGVVAIGVDPIERWLFEDNEAKSCL